MSAAKQCNPVLTSLQTSSPNNEFEDPGEIQEQVL